MALSFEAVKQAFKVMNQLDLQEIRSFPPDFYNHVEEHEQKSPIGDKTYGIDQKADGGWEKLFFFKKNPSPEFVAKWEELKDTVPNSSFSRKHKENEEYTIFGWF